MIQTSQIQRGLEINI